MSRVMEWDDGTPMEWDIDIAAIVRDILGAFPDSGPDTMPSVTELERIAEVAVTLCHRFAPNAPDAVLKEAAARTAAYLFQMPRGNITTERVGDMEAQYAPHRMAALRHSGAMSILSPWKSRRAGVIA